MRDIDVEYGTYRFVETGNPVVGSRDNLSMKAPPVIRVKVNGGFERKHVSMPEVIDVIL